MIFYFTGTGNSLFAAKRLLDKDELLVNIADAINNNNYEFTVKEGEKIGFVFPVYFYTVPSIVAGFISKLNLLNADYVYAVITCGGSIGQAGNVLKKLLKERGVNLKFVSSLLMPDNSMLFYQIPPVSKAKSRLSDADSILKNIKAKIESCEVSKIGNSTIISDLIGKGYKWCSGTKKYYADQNCTGCGLCEKNCPEKVIVLKDKKPAWIKPACSKCSACINRCPANAIQYGKGTIRRNRYVNPEV